ncbi:MAG: dihydrolipoamide acetyltransferase family protein [Patulibacter sp.]
MSVELVMPRLSDAMEEGTIVRWLKQPGDAIAQGESIVEIETDKATVEHEAEADGVLLEILVAEGETVPLDQPIARFGAPGATVPAAASTTAAPSAASAGTPDGGSGPRPASSPVARRMARELGLELRAIAGSGPKGRIVKADVLAASSASTAAGPVRPAPRVDAPPATARVPAASAASSSPASVDPPAASGVRYETPTRTQRLVARRMVEATASVPDFTLFADVKMDACLRLRARLKQLHDRPPSVNDMVVKAAALALRDHPRANGSYRDDRFALHDRVNVGMAVASDEGLVVPTVFDADTKPLGVIAGETRGLAAAVRDGTVTPAQLSGGTFTVSNLGMFGVDAFTAIVNPPQAAILSVGAIRKQPIADDDGNVSVGDLMTLGLISDHRILNGADAARFLARIRELLEEPLAMAF